MIEPKGVSRRRPTARPPHAPLRKTAPANRSRNQFARGSWPDRTSPLFVGSSPACMDVRFQASTTKSAAAALEAFANVAEAQRECPLSLTIDQDRSGRTRPEAAARVNTANVSIAASADIPISVAAPLAGVRRLAEWRPREQHGSGAGRRRQDGDCDQPSRGRLQEQCQTPAQAGSNVSPFGP